MHDVYRTTSVSDSISVSCLSRQLIAICRNSEWAISTDFSKSKMLLVSFLLLQMLRTKTDWTGYIFAVVLYVGWYQMAKAEYVCIRVLINSTSSQAKDAFGSSTATGWLHCILLAINLVTFWSLRDSTASCPMVHHSPLACSWSNIIMYNEMSHWASLASWKERVKSRKKKGKKQ